MPAPPVEGSSTYYFLPEAAQLCATEIHEAGGVEVFFIGRRGETGLVEEVEAHAYGTSGSVPALSHLAKPGDILIHNHPGGNLMPSDADISVASGAGNMGIGFYIIDDACKRCRIVVRGHDPKKKVMLGEAEVLERLSPRGDLARNVDGWEDRPQQRDMAGAVTRALNHDGIAVVEAGTGVGKSFAYLMPAVLFAIKNNERIVVSTNTINLQEQLLHKDIPAIRAAVKEPFDVEIVKGRSNYVCKRKAEYAREESKYLIEDEFVRELRDVLHWAETSPTGDRQELPIPPKHEVWERVQSESDNCLRVRCQFYEECFFYNSRRRAARARLLIVNHSLLMSDLAVRRITGNYSMAAVLPPYSRVILDEAHHLEEVATRSLASQITRPGVRQILGRLHRRDSAGGARGVLNSLTDEIDNLVQKKKLQATDPLIQRLYFELIPRVGDVRDSIDFMLQDFAQQFLRAANIRTVNPREDQKIRIVPAIEQTQLYRDECGRLLEQIAAELAEFVDLNRTLSEAFNEYDESIELALTNPRLEWGALIGRMDELRMTVMAFLNGDPTMCRWIELSQRSTGNRELLLRICIAPVDVRQVLRESLHDKMKCEVMTSATLTVDREFDFFNERTGLPTLKNVKAKEQVDEDGLPVRDIEPQEARAIETKLLSTPFDFRQQVFFAVPSDLPDPRDAQFDEALADLINRSVAISGGRAFILFTSFGQLRRVADLCEGFIRKLGIEVLRQGDESRDMLLRRFREDETSVLFATSSFWEGVDVRGRALELLIIAKLPFAVPNEPIQEAQFEALKAQGRDPFDALVVPRAVIRFKQGFGRLIRSRTDRGAVIIADKRVVQMGYGRRFVRSLPELEVRKGMTRDLMGEMEKFFETKKVEVV
ncbi:ATP-dependent DNA helicase DinG [soil metagenome]